MQLPNSHPSIRVCSTVYTTLDTLINMEVIRMAFPHNNHTGIIHLYSNIITCAIFKLLIDIWVFNIEYTVVVKFAPILLLKIRFCSNSKSCLLA